MAKVLTILTDGDDRLRARAQEVGSINKQVLESIDDMVATLCDFRARVGFGRAIAAPQVGIGQRIIALHLGATPFAIINPEIVWTSDTFVELWDDCLSVPAHMVRVRRHVSVSLRFTDARGTSWLWERLPQHMSELVQHEVDHLDGILMLDRACAGDAIRPFSERPALSPYVPPVHRIRLEGIRAASQAIDPVFRNTPQYACEPLSAELGCELVLKVEVMNPLRSFKGRGADYFLKAVRQRGDRRKMVSASAGNWGQAMAYVCRAGNEPIEVFAALNVNPLKARRMRDMGAELRLGGHDFDEAKSIARAYCVETGACFAEDGLEVEISEGAGSIAVELMAYAHAFDAVLVPLGNGALINGVARWIKAAAPWTQVIGVSATGAPAMAHSWRARTPLPETQAHTIADGVAVRIPVPEAVNDMLDLVDDVILVPDALMVRAMRMVHQHTGLVLEPSGALGVTAILHEPARFRGKKIATILCGGNLPQEGVEKYLFQTTAA